MVIFWQRIKELQEIMKENLLLQIEINLDSRVRQALLVQPENDRFDYYVN
jgi:hypothetical protein